MYRLIVIFNVSYLSVSMLLYLVGIPYFGVYDLVAILQQSGHSLFNKRNNSNHEYKIIYIYNINSFPY